MRRSKEHILVTKWKIFALKRKITLGQSNPENLLTEEIISYKAVVLIYSYAVVVPLTLTHTYT
jgi:hypothetical protein